MDESCVVLQEERTASGRGQACKGASSWWVSPIHLEAFQQAMHVVLQGDVNIVIGGKALGPCLSPKLQRITCNPPVIPLFDHHTIRTGSCIVSTIA